MDLRAVAWRALTVAGSLVLMGHSPYRQWAVYRQTHLVGVADDDAPGAFSVASDMARLLAERLPRTRAVAASARSAVEVVQLLRSRQLPVAVLLTVDAMEALAGQGTFAGYPPLPLRALASEGPYLLVALEDFPAREAATIAQVLAEHPVGESLPRKVGGGSFPFHPAIAPGMSQQGAREPAGD